MSYSLSQIRGAHAQKKEYDRQFPLSFYGVRPLSFLVSYALLKVTRSPSQVAYAALVIGLAGGMALVLLREISLWPGYLLLVVFILLDASDGNIARVTENVTYYGRFLDGVVGEIVEGGYCFWLGLGLFRQGKSLDWLGLRGSGVTSARMALILAGVSVALGRLYSSRIVAAYYAYCRLKRADPGTAGEDVRATIGTSRYQKFWWYRLFLNLGSIDLQLALLGVCGVFDRADLFLLLFAIFYLFQSLLYTLFYLKRAARELV